MVNEGLEVRNALSCNKARIAGSHFLESEVPKSDASSPVIVRAFAVIDATAALRMSRMPWIN